MIRIIVLIVVTVTILKTIISMLIKTITIIVILIMVTIKALLSPGFRKDSFGTVFNRISLASGYVQLFCCKVAYLIHIY